MKLLALAILLPGCLLSMARAQDMVIYDGARESGWENYGWATINYANPTPVHSGTASISVIDPGSKSKALSLGHAPFDTTPYQALSFWIYPTASGADELQVRATLSGTAQAAVPLSFTPAQVGKWQPVTIPLASLGVAGNPGFTGFWIQNITGHPLTFYVDAVSLIAIPTPHLVPLTVNAQTAIRTINGRLYGVNLAVWDRYLSRPPTPAILSAISAGAVRFPGGSASDDYDWQTGRPVSGRQFHWPADAATFARVTQAQGVQPFITVNYGSGTPEQAAAWVAYYNGDPSSPSPLGVDAKGRDWKTAGYWAALRAAAPLPVDDGQNFLRASHPAPFGFKYWEIGNECYGGWERDDHGAAGSGLTGAPHDPYTYAGAFAAFYKQMLAVDPSIRVGAVATVGEDAFGGKTHGVPNPNVPASLHTGWTPVLLATLKSLGVTPQFLIYHNYPLNPGREDDAVLLQSGAKLKSDAKNLRRMIADYLGASGSSIELDVTELNSVSSRPGKESTSLVNALFFADALGNLAGTEFNACIWWDLRNGAVTDANNNPLLYGWRRPWRLRPRLDRRPRRAAECPLPHVLRGAIAHPLGPRRRRRRQRHQRLLPPLHLRRTPRRQQPRPPGNKQAPHRRSHRQHYAKWLHPRLGIRRALLLRKTERSREHTHHHRRHPNLRPRLHPHLPLLFHQRAGPERPLALPWDRHSPEWHPSKDAGGVHFHPAPPPQTICI